MILQAENISFAYRPGQQVLRDITLDVKPGVVTALLGPNGCGKSTLLRCMNGSLRPQSGCITLGGRQLNSISPRQIACQVAVVPQDTPVDAPFTAGEMVMLARYARWDLWGQQSEHDTQVVGNCLDRMGIPDLSGRFFNQLSGGERQRVIIARALAQQGRVLLLDEPASHLDIAHQLELYRIVRELAAEGQAVLMVCHDILIAPMFVDVAVLMTAGSILATGAPSQVLTPDNLLAAFDSRLEIDWTDGRCVHATLT